MPRSKMGTASGRRDILPILCPPLPRCDSSSKVREVIVLVGVRGFPWLCGILFLVGFFPFPRASHNTRERIPQSHGEPQTLWAILSNFSLVLWREGSPVTTQRRASILSILSLVIVGSTLLPIQYRLLRFIALRCLQVTTGSSHICASRD